MHSETLKFLMPLSNIVAFFPAVDKTEVIPIAL